MKVMMKGLKNLVFVDVDVIVDVNGVVRVIVVDVK